MTDKNVVKQLEELLEPIKKDLGEINRKLGEHTENFSAINQKLGEHTEALVNIEDTIKIYGDMYQVNNDNARKLEKRIVAIEGLDGIETPPELKLASF